MKRLTSFVRSGTLAKWLKRLQARAASQGGTVRSVQGDTWLETGEEYFFSGQVRRVPGGVRVIPFFWQLASDVFATHHVPTTLFEQSLLDDPTLTLPAEDCVVFMTIHGRIDDVTANATTGILDYTQTVLSVQVQVGTSLPSSINARVEGERGVGPGPSFTPYYTVTSVQPSARYAIPLATVSPSGIQHAFGSVPDLVHGLGVVQVRVLVEIAVEVIP